MSKLKKILLIFVLFFIIVLLKNCSYAATKEEVGGSLANFTNKFYEEYKGDVVYSYGDDEQEKMAKAGLTIDGKYKFDSNDDFVYFALENCLHIESLGLSFDNDSDWEVILDQFETEQVDTGGFKIKNINNLKARRYMPNSR